MKIPQFLTVTKILAEADSKYNGHMRVVRDLAWGTYIQADGLTQSGGVVTNIWKSTFKELKRSKKEIRKCLLLGLGGGTVAKFVRKNYPESTITGVDIDPTIIEWGEKYLNLKDLSVNAVNMDANKYLKNCTEIFDLIVIDMYQGRSIPTEFTTLEFAKKIAALLDEKGIAVFNRLYYGEKRPEAMRFLKTLEKVFSNVDPIYPQANVIFLCSAVIAAL